MYSCITYIFIYTCLDATSPSAARKRFLLSPGSLSLVLQLEVKWMVVKGQHMDEISKEGCSLSNPSQSRSSPTPQQGVGRVPVAWEFEAAAGTLAAKHGNMFGCHFPLCCTQKIPFVTWLFESSVAAGSEVDGGQRAAHG